MAIQHLNIPDAQRHEPRGMSTAPVNTSYISNGSGSGTWKRVPPAGIDSGVAAKGYSLETDASGQLVAKQYLTRLLSSESVFSEVAANSSSVQTLTVPGIQLTDEIIHIQKPLPQVGLILNHTRVLSLNTLNLQFINVTNNPVTPTSGETYVVYVRRN